MTTDFESVLKRPVAKESVFYWDLIKKRILMKNMI